MEIYRVVVKDLHTEETSQIRTADIDSSTFIDRLVGTVEADNFLVNAISHK